MEKPGKEKIFSNIQLLRFIAACLVMFFHVTPAMDSMLGIHNNIFDPIRFIGFAGVDLFFVISGFVIYYSGDQFSPMENKLNPVVFIAVRLARIFIGYWPFYLLTVAMLFFLKPEILAKIDLETSLFLIPDKLVDTLIGVSWSLSYEIYFYILFLFILFSEHKVKLIIVFSIIIISFNLYAGYMYNFFTYRENNAIIIYKKFFTDLWLIEFFIGCLVAHLIKNNVHAYPAFCLSMGILLFIFGYYLNVHVFHGNLIQLPKHPYRIAVFGIASGLIVYGLAILEKNGRAFFPRFSLLVGGASYCIYLSHSLIIDFIQYAGIAPFMLNSPLSSGACFLLTIIGILCFSIMFYRFFEKPLYLKSKQWIYGIYHFRSCDC